MKDTKSAYALPTNTKQKDEQPALPRRRSETAVLPPPRWIDERELHFLRKAIAEGLEDMVEIHQEIERDFNDADEELHCANC